MSTAEATMFVLLAPLTVAGALGLLFARKAVHAAVSMAATMVSLGLFYVVQDAEFVGIVQIFVYAGAVMMLFLFVIMLIGVGSTVSMVETIKGQRWAGLFLAVGIAGLLGLSLGTAQFGDAVGLDAARESGSVIGIAFKVFGPYVLPFEVLSAVLTVAALGAMVLAHKTRIGGAQGQRELSEQRIKKNEHVAGLPAPGVYARHNAADTPALLPDGTPSELSVSRVLVARDQVMQPEDHTRSSDEIERELKEGRQR